MNQEQDRAFARITHHTLALHPSPQAASAGTPTVSQFLNAANTEYVLGGTPAGMHPFTIFGIPVSYTNDLDGVSARVWVTAQNQVIIAYQGTTGGENIAINPAAALTQLIADVGVYAGTTTFGELDSANFANFVVRAANLQRFATSNIFVTGHSLGGIEAEYVAQHTGLAGIGFESTGIPHYAGQGSGANFVNVVTYGDPVGNYASDIRGEQPFAPAYVAGGGALPHYGQIVMVGSPSDQTTLSQGVAGWGGGSILNNVAVLGNLITLLADFHLPGTQAHDLGVTLNPYSQLVDGIGIQDRAVLSAAGDSIPQLVTAAGAIGHVSPGLAHLM